MIQTSDSLRSSRDRANRLRQWLTLASVLGAIAVNFLSTRWPRATESVGRLSNTLFTSVQIIPANYAFAIWGLIYVGLITFCIAQLQPNQQQNLRLQRHNWLLIVASLAQCAWIYTFQAKLFALSTLPMVIIFGALMWLYLGLGVGRLRVSQRDRRLIHAPISLYFGWITVATVVNMAIALFSLGWHGWGISPTLWTVVMMVVSSAIAARMIVHRHDGVYGGVMVWALVAIAVKPAATLPVMVAGGILAIGLGLLLAGRLMRNENFDDQRSRS